MTRSAHTAPSGGGLGPAAMIAVLLAVLGALLAPSAYGVTAPPLPYGAALVSGAAQADSGLHADDEAAGCGAAARGHRDTTGERPVLPAHAILVPRYWADRPRPFVSTLLSQVRPPSHAQSADCHPLRAPPPPPGT